MQKDAEGRTVKIKAWWEGSIHKSKIEGGRHGTMETWRYMEGGLMMVRTILLNKANPPVSVLWYLEAMQVPGEASDYFCALFRDKTRCVQHTKHQTICIHSFCAAVDKEAETVLKDINRIQNATQKDNLYAQVSQPMPC